MLYDYPNPIQFNNLLYVIFAGSNQHLYIKTSSDGVNFSAAVEHSTVLKATPSAAVFNGLLWLAVYDKDLNEYVIYNSSDGSGFYEVQQMAPTTFAPSLAVFSGKLYMFWETSPSTLAVASSTGGVFGSPVSIPLPSPSSSMVSAVAANGALTLTYKNTQDYVVVAQTIDPQDSSKYGYQVTTSVAISAPTVVSFDTAVYIGFEGNNGHLFMKGSYNGFNFTAAQQYGAVINSQPGLGTFNVPGNKLIVGWKAADPSDYMWLGIAGPPN